MRHYRYGVHTKTELKVHRVWVPKYRKRVLSGAVAVRVRDVLGQIAMEHELAIMTGKVSVRPLGFSVLRRHSWVNCAPEPDSYPHLHDHHRGLLALLGPPDETL